MHFRDFEQTGWGNDSVALMYHRHLGDVTTGCIPKLLDAVALQAGDRVLDVACGAGYVAAAARDRGADAVGVDFPRRKFDWRSKPIRTSDLSRATPRPCLARTESSTRSSMPSVCRTFPIQTRPRRRPTAFSSRAGDLATRRGASPPNVSASRWSDGAIHRIISVPAPWSVNSSSSTACGTLPSRMTTPSTPASSA